MRFLFLLFILLPIMEMVVLIEVGSVIGAWNAVALVIISAFVGINIIRSQGFSNALKTREKLATGESPAVEMLESLFIAVGGLLMIIPGFMTDFAGILMLIPPLRRWMIKSWFRKLGMKARQSNIYEAEHRRESDGFHTQTHIHHTIDGDFTRESDDQGPKL